MSCNLFISNLGWSLGQTIETYVRLHTFDEDWNALGMKGYDDL